MANLIINRQKSIQALHFTVIVELSIWSIFSNLCCLLLKRQSSYAHSCDYREFSKSVLYRSTTVSNSENELYLAAGFGFSTVQLLSWLEPHDRSLKLCRQEGGHGWSLTWGGTPASGPDVHAALGMQNLSSGIFPRSLTTAVEDIAEKNTCKNSLTANVV